MKLLKQMFSGLKELAPKSPELVPLILALSVLFAFASIFVLTLKIGG